MTEPVERPRLERVGLGYRVRWDGAHVEFAIDRLRDSRGQLQGELTVTGQRNGTGIAERHLFAGHVNLSSLQSRKTLAAFLKERGHNGTDWPELLEQFCVGVLGEHRRGQPFEVIGRRPPRPAVEYRLGPIIPDLEAVLLLAPGGTGKSTIAAACAVSVAAGREIVPSWVPRRAEVLILDYEANDATWNDLIARIATGAGVAAPEVHYRNCGGRSLPDQLEEVSRLVAERTVGLVVVDSVGLATPAGRDGSDANEGALRLFAALRELRTSALLIDHVRGDDVERERAQVKAYGSIYKMNLARSVYELRRSRDSDELVLIHTKANNGPRQHSVGLRIEYDGDTGPIRFERSTIEAPEL